ncbi:MAG: hypothetical protein HY012_01310 [Acidobacteria bacterium]|nr:hypothetical protein [Acidobacteriota bacterium]
MTRAEKRIPMAVAVRIAGHAAMPGVETTLAGNFNSVARVAWCSPAREVGFAIGLQFVEASGNWVVAPAAAS